MNVIRLLCYLYFYLCLFTKLHLYPVADQDQRDRIGIVCDNNRESTITRSHQNSMQAVPDSAGTRQVSSAFFVSLEYASKNLTIVPVNITASISSCFEGRVGCSAADNWHRLSYMNPSHNLKCILETSTTFAQ